MRSKILLTGGSGFIGANLTRHLIGYDYDVTLLLRHKSNLWRLKGVVNKINIVYGDLTNDVQINNIVKTLKPNIIYHLAAYGAYSHQDIAEKILKTNVFGTLNLLKACRNIDIELFVNTGSSSEYGFKSKPMKETDILEPNSHYAVAKATQTHLVSHHSLTYNIPAVTLRPFSVYGPYEEPGRLIPNLLMSFIKKDELRMVSKNVVRDFVYIDDYLDACLSINTLKKYPGQVFNIGSGTETNFGKLVSTTQKIIGEKGNISWNTSEGKKWDSNHWKADMFKSRKLLEFEPRYTLSEGLQKSWEWFKTNHQLYV